MRKLTLSRFTAFSLAFSAPTLLLINSFMTSSRLTVPSPSMSYSLK